MGGNFVEKSSETDVGDEKWPFSWDENSRLVQVSKGIYAAGEVLENKFTVDYHYDERGRTLRRASGAEVITFVWDGWDFLSETTDSVTTTHLVPDGLMWSFVHGEEVLARFEYGAWGELLSGSFNGVGTDLKMGLMDVRHRWYCPASQGFVSRDPIGLEGGANLFTYVENNPVNWVDPSGLEQCPPGYRYGGSSGMEKIPGYDWDALGDRMQKAPGRVAAGVAVAATAYEVAVGAALALPYAGYRLASAGYSSAASVATATGLGLSRMMSGNQPLYHGSINDASKIRREGFQVRNCKTYVSPHREAAENAIGVNRTRINPASDPGIVEINLPKNHYRRHLEKLGEPYGGWSRPTRDLTEIPVTDPYHIHLLNATRKR